VKLVFRGLDHGLGAWQQIVRVPDTLSDLAIEETPSLKRFLGELCDRFNVKLALFLETEEPGIVVVTLGVQRSRQQVVCVVMWEFLKVGEVAVATFRRKNEMVGTMFTEVGVSG